MTLSLVLLSLLLTLTLAVEKSSAATKKFCLHHHHHHFSSSSSAADSREYDLALYDYALHLQSIMPGLLEVAVLMPESSSSSSGGGNNHVMSVLMARWKEQFPVFTYSLPADQAAIAGGRKLAELAESQSCDILYLLKAGGKDSPPSYPASFSDQVRTVVHAWLDWEPHGDAYAAVSSSVANPMANKVVVPFIVPSPPPSSSPASNASSLDLRAEYHIPPQATVICRHGGRDGFDLEIAQQAVKEVAEELGPSKIHFVFLNTKTFLTAKHHRPKNIHFLHGSHSNTENQAFLQTCQAMIHGRSFGETFGLSVADFAVRNKPVLTFANSTHRTHIELMNGTAFLYHSKEECKSYLKDWITKGLPSPPPSTFYHQCSPEKVMKSFRDIFIDPVLLLTKRSSSSSNTTSFLRTQMKHSTPALQSLELYKHPMTLNHTVLAKSKTFDYKQEHYYFFVYTPSLDRYVSSAMIENGGQWEANLNALFQHFWEKEHEGGKSKDPSLDVVIDAGMNFGSFTLFAASLGAKVFAFEMQDELVSLVQLSIRASGYNHHVFVYHTAIWNETGLSLAYNPQIGNFGGTSVQNQEQIEKKDITHYIQSIRLDTVITPEPIFFFKMDIEGIEMEALQGLGKVLTERHIHHIAFEARYDKYESIAKWFFEIGYQVCQVFDEPKEDCSFPRVDRHCIFYSFSEMQTYFRNHHDAFVKRTMPRDFYVDVHCSLHRADALL